MIKIKISNEIIAFNTDMSQPSLGGLGDREDRDEGTPPVSPLFPSEGTSGLGAGASSKSKQGLFPQKSASNFARKYQDSSLDGDDTESELVAIPESDLSESTLHNSSAPGSFDEPLNFDEIVQPMRTEQVKGKVVTTANLATAQVALSTLGVAERTEEKSEVKKPSRLFMKLNSLDKSHDKSLQKSGSALAETARLASKCSVQEGVRMMVTPSMFMTGQAAIETAVLSPPVTVQRAVVVSQDSKTSTASTKDVSEVDSAKPTSAMASMIAETSTSVAKQIAVGSGMK